MCLCLICNIEKLFTYFINGCFIFRVLKLAQSNPKGISDKDVNQELPHLLPKDRATIFNKLLTQVKIIHY